MTETNANGERGLALVMRKCRSLLHLVSYKGQRAGTKLGNLLAKRGRHYSSRLARARHHARTMMRDLRTASTNLAGTAWRRFLGLRKPFVRGWKRHERKQQRRAVERFERGVERRVNGVAGSRRPIILGPWLSEVGFEVLYWIPFLNWLKAQHNWDPARVVAVSRGGVASWYDGLASTYIEIFERFDPAEFARRNEVRRESGEGSHKQMTLSPLDQDVLDYVRERAGVRDAVVVHPSDMYRLFRYYWLGHRGVSHVEERTRFAPHRFDLSGLPREYVAVKAYTAASLPDTPQNRARLLAIIHHLSAHTNVVALDTGLQLDDHADFGLDREHRVFNLSGRLTPANNLELQTQVMAGAQAFVGTCGALTWLAPMLGVNTVALFSETRFLHPHLYFARKAYLNTGAARFATVDVSAASDLRLDAVIRGVVGGVA
jgi:hypothetical protein